MNSTELAALLNRIGACSDAVEWAEGKDLQTAWDTFPRAGWMLWIVGRMVGVKGWPSRQTVVLAACDCAEEALPFVAAGENRPKEAIETARKWARGEATMYEVRIAYEAAYAAAAAAADPAAVLAADAVYSAAVAAVASDAASRAGVPQERLVEIVRKRIPVPYKEAK